MDYQLITMYIGIGYLLGIISGLLLNKHNFSTEKVVSLVLTTVWILLHIFGFVLVKNVPFIFDVIGAGAVGNIAKLNVVTLFKSFRK